MLSHGGVERLPEDAGRAAAAREVHLRDDRGAQGPGHHPVALPALRLQAHPHAVHRPAPRRRAGAGDASRPIAAAVQVLAREAAGSMRDAMSLLDQVIAFSGTKLTRRRRGARARRGRSPDPARAGDGARRRATRAACLGVVDASGAAGVRSHARDEGRPAAPAQPGRRQGVRGQAGGEGPSCASCWISPTKSRATCWSSPDAPEADDLSRLFQGFSRAFDDIVRSGQPRMALEMALVRLARRPPLLALDELLVARRGARAASRRCAAPGPAPRGGGGGSGGGAVDARSRRMPPRWCRPRRRRTPPRRGRTGPGAGHPRETVAAHPHAPVSVVPSPGPRAARHRSPLRLRRRRGPRPPRHRTWPCGAPSSTASGRAVRRWPRSSSTRSRWRPPPRASWSASSRARPSSGPAPASRMPWRS